MSARARQHFTLLKQVNQSIEAAEGEPEIGFMARLLALCSLPRTNPRDRLQYVRRNGLYTLGMSAGIKGLGEQWNRKYGRRLDLGPPE